MPTRLMPDLIDRLDKASPLMVLDVGFGVHETVEYFGDRRCRLHFAGLHETVSVPPANKLKTPFGQMVDKAAQEEAMHAAWLEKFQAAMNFEPGTCFDLCLFWDFCNYLDDMALKAFADALAPFVGPATLGHAYILLKPDIEMGS